MKFGECEATYGFDAERFATGVTTRSANVAYAEVSYRVMTPSGLHKWAVTPHAYGRSFHGGESGETVVG